MADYASGGYDDVRNYVYNNHTWLAIIDDSGTEVTRIDLSSSSLVTEESDAGSNPIEYMIELSGADIESAGATLPITLTDMELYDSSSSSTVFATDEFRDSSDNSTTATLEAPADKIVTTFTNEWPTQ